MWPIPIQGFGTIRHSMTIGAVPHLAQLQEVAVTPGGVVLLKDSQALLRIGGAGHPDRQSSPTSTPPELVIHQTDPYRQWCLKKGFPLAVFGSQPDGKIATLGRRAAPNLLETLPVILREVPVVPKLRIVVPVYNEADCLERILLETFEAGYLDRISFVNDASTDDSEAILRRWQETHDIDVLHLRQNRRKEGAIREVLEAMANQEELPPFVCLLDADSIIETGGSSIDELFETALELMEQQDIAGLALRIEARIEPDANVLQKCIYVDYSAVQFDNWITSKQWQLWVINGPGGLFRGDDLLDALRNLTPDFETGDLQISVNLMKQGLRIAFYPDITVRTAVPGTLSAYFQQRRRWERGTTKVLWGDRGFYLRTLPKATACSHSS